MDSVETYRAVFESSPDGLIVADQGGKIVLVNNQIIALFGYEKDELIGQHIEMVIPQRYHHHHSQHLNNYASNPTPREMGAKKELWATKKDGSEFAVEISLSPIQLKDRVLFSAAIRDVSARKKIETEIHIQNKQLQIQNNELEQFAYISSHDLQEPLHSLMSFAELLKTEYATKLDQNAAAYINYISLSSMRMRDLIKALLEYSRIGKEREFSLVDCNQLITEILSNMTQSITETKAIITVDTLPIIKGFEIELRQLFQNLISNAIKYVAKGVRPKLNISATKKGHEWQFALSDNGIGIAKEDQDKIFIIFKRLHNRNEYEGSGIGLSYCKKIVELHQGTIWMDSKINEGSVFNFTINIF